MQNEQDLRRWFDVLKRAQNPAGGGRVKAEGLVDPLISIGIANSKKQAERLIRALQLNAFPDGTLDADAFCAIVGTALESQRNLQDILAPTEDAAQLTVPTQITLHRRQVVLGALEAYATPKPPAGGSKTVEAAPISKSMKRFQRTAEAMQRAPQWIQAMNESTFDPDDDEGSRASVDSDHNTRVARMVQFRSTGGKYSRIDPEAIPIRQVGARKLAQTRRKQEAAQAEVDPKWKDYEIMQKRWKPIVTSGFGTKSQATAARIRREPTLRVGTAPTLTSESESPSGSDRLGRSFGPSGRLQVPIESIKAVNQEYTPEELKTLKHIRLENRKLEKPSVATPITVPVYSFESSIPSATEIHLGSQHQDSIRSTKDSLLRSHPSMWHERLTQSRSTLP